MTSEKGKNEGVQGNTSLGFVSSPRAHYISQGEGAAVTGQWVGSGLEDDAEAGMGPLEHAGGGWRQMWAPLQTELRPVGEGALCR